LSIGLGGEINEEVTESDDNDKEDGPEKDDGQ